MAKWALISLETVRTDEEGTHQKVERSEDSHAGQADGSQVHPVPHATPNASVNFYSVHCNSEDLHYFENLPL